MRILLAWLDEAEAVAALRGFIMPVAGEDVSEQQRIVARLRANLAARAPFALPLPELAPLPPSIYEIAEERMEHARTGSGAHGLRVGVIDLRSVIGFQKIVAVDGTADRVAGVEADDWEALLDLCLPAPGTTAEIRGTIDSDGKGVTFASLNPNLQVSRVQQTPSKGPGLSFTFNVMLGPSVLHVAEFEGRCILKDGYHRAHALLARGITHVPCGWYRAANPNEVLKPKPAFVRPEQLFGPRPPLLTDYLDSDVAAEVFQPVFQKGVRIRAEEFLINS